MASIVSSIFDWCHFASFLAHCVMGTDEYNGANGLSMFPLSAAGSSLLYGIVGVQWIAVVLLLAYPIPFKYDFSLPYVSKSLFTASGFVIGAMIYMYLVYDKHKSHARDCNPVTSGIMHLVFSCLHNVNECFEVAGLYNKKATTQMANNPTSTDCFYAGSFNIFLALMLFSVIQVLYNSLFAQKLVFTNIVSVFSSKTYGKCIVDT